MMGNDGGRIDEGAIQGLEDHRHDMKNCGEGVYRCVCCTLELRSVV